MAGEKETTKATKAAEERQQWWGTSEELLLACAVNRHGTKSWDSIATEVQNRTSTMSSLTPKSCEDKFHDLTRRFGFPSQNDAESGGTGGGGSFLVVPALVDRLRRIRVQELRAEVQRRDVSIVSLEMKVKRLEEERERSEEADADPQRETKASPEIVAGKSSAVEADSDERENRSFNESNSMTQKPETTTNKEQNDAVMDVEKRAPTKVKPEPGAEAGPVLDEPDRDRGWSSNGKLNETGNVKDDDENDKTTSDGEIKNNKTSGAGGLSESNELWDESKSEGKEAGLKVAAAAVPKQSSDVQSSASLSKTMRRGGAAGCSSSEEVSPARKKVLAVKSEPLMGLLAMIRSHRLGSHFERRLRSQETERYKKLVRQHIDLRTIQSRLDRGIYSNCFHRFYRDLLVLFNNFIIFFKKTSQEHAAARELRALVIKEMTDKLRKPKPEPELELARVVSVSKPSRGSTMVPCGRRSAVKALSERKEKEKPMMNEKKVGGSLLGVEEKGVKKKRSNERSVSGHKNSRSGSNNNNNNRSNKKGGGGGGGGGGGEVKHQYGNNELSSHDALDAKLDKKEISMKKRGAASFLRRMKQNSPKKVAEEESDEEEEDEDDDDEEEEEKDSEDESKDSRVEEEKMKKGRGRNNNNNSKKNNNSNNKREVRRERVTRSSSNSRGRGGEREESGKSGRKVVGRPPKRSAAVGSGERKRGRDDGDSEVGVAGGGGGGKSARKRTRR